MKKQILFLTAIIIVVLTSCKKEKEENEPTPPVPVVTPQTSYTYQYLTKSDAGGASANAIYWVIENDTLHLGECQGTYGSGDYYKSFNFEVGKEYNFKILRGIPPSLTSFELKNEGTIKFIDNNSSTDVYGGQSSVVYTQGTTWTYDINYGQCGSITNQLIVMVP